MTDREQRIAILRSAIGACRCRLSEDWQSNESQTISRKNLANYRAELAELNASKQR